MATNANRRRDVPGTIYLLHFDTPYRHAKHYLGWTSDLQGRLADHAAGRGARLMEVTRAAGIGFVLARTWPGTRSRERQLKGEGGRSRMCPICKAVAAANRAPDR
jgi:predicted GIY-YIG superfamily endonuclease